MNVGAVGYLQKLPLFRDIPDHVLGKLAGQLTERRLETGELLFSRGDSGNSVYIIQTGWVKISLRDSNGDELTLNECGPGEVVGELSLIDEEPRSASVSALSTVTVLELKRQVFLDILADEPHLYFDITRNIASKLRFATTYIEKMIEWSHRITAGDYDPALGQIQTEQSAISLNQSDDAARANHMLAAFFRMVEGFKQREDDLKEQLRDLSIHIDKEKRQQEFEKVTGSSFFDNLKTAAHEIRQQRYAEGKK